MHIKLTIKTISLMILGLWLLAACAAFEDPSKKATQNAQNTALWTRVYGLETRESTVEALRQTADSANRLATDLANSNAQLQAERVTNQALLRNPSAVGQGGGQFSTPTVTGGGAINRPSTNITTNSDTITNSIYPS